MNSRPATGSEAAVSSEPAVGSEPGVSSGPAVMGRGARHRILDVAARAVIGLVAPLAIYYLLRAAGAGVYLALLVSTLVSALPSLVGLVRRQRINALSAYFTTMLLGSVVVSAIAGSTEFLLAKEAVLTGVTGLWFLVSAFTRHPLAYVFTRPLAQGRLRWPDNWDELWERSPRWRRMWRLSSVLWGCGTLADAVLRVYFAYTLPPDTVPALATGLIAATTALLFVVTNVLYIACGVFNPRSGLYAGSDAAAPGRVT
jgi:hypothetical protein